VRRVLRPILIFLAILFLIEAWLWDRLEPIVAWIVDRIPLQRLKRRIAASIDHLPPPATLAVFIVPFVVLLPLKLFAIWLITEGTPSLNESYEALAQHRDVVDAIASGNVARAQKAMQAALGDFPADVKRRALG